MEPQFFTSDLTPPKTFVSIFSVFASLSRPKTSWKYDYEQLYIPRNFDQHSSGYPFFIRIPGASQMASWWLLKALDFMRL